MTYSELVSAIAEKRSFLCVGLDTCWEKIPQCLKNQDKRSAIVQFNKAIIQATAPFTVAYKPNLAFYSCEGIEGMQALMDTIAYLHSEYPEIFVILDAKYGDIGNTAQRYAQTAFGQFRADAVTLAPYMGYDSVAPFLTYDAGDSSPWAIILALTSNPSSKDFQMLQTPDSVAFFEHVLQTSIRWDGSSKENTMFVVGATQAEMLESIRQIVPEHFLLVPGVGAQGGSLQKVAQYGMNSEKCGLLVNSSRGIIYASGNEDFAEAAAAKAKELQAEMAELLGRYSSL